MQDKTTAEFNLAWHTYAIARGGIDSKPRRIRDESARKKFDALTAVRAGVVEMTCVASEGWVVA